MIERLFDGNLRFEQMRGVGTMQVEFVPQQRAYVFIGENGIGKTKLLESLFAVLLLSSKKVQNYSVHPWVKKEILPFKAFSFEQIDFKQDISALSGGQEGFSRNIFNNLPHWQKHSHDFPIVYLAAQNRGTINNSHDPIKRLGTFQERNSNYLKLLVDVFGSSGDIKSLNTDSNIEEWIIQRAQSANPYQAKEDNRKIEIDTLLDLLNRIDERIDREFMEISGNNRVFVKVEGKKTELSDLSSGFASILKIIQSIIAGYSYFTNEIQIAHVRGVVLIDEIESHLHNEWQVKIVPLLKTLFPNTTFFLTTHSSLVISQLEQGEAYRLARHGDGVVYGSVIEYPNQASFVDLLHDAFDVDLNQLKIKRANERGQADAKKSLLQLVRRELDKAEG